MICRGNGILSRFLVFLLVCTHFSRMSHAHCAGCLPQQIHISLAENPTNVIVTWVTNSPTANSIVIYGLSNLDQKRAGLMFPFQDGGAEKRTMFIHRVTLNDLLAQNTYFYKCGSKDGWSDLLHFRSLPAHPHWSPRLVIFGDMGTTNAQALPQLMKEVKELDNIDVLLHVGDFAYNLEDDNARNGDLFMYQIQPMASKVPYMTCPGNHEAAYNFSNYRNRFSMPGGDGESQFYSFNVGPAHIIAFSSEFYYYLYYGWKQVVRQYNWLIEDLKVANDPTNRLTRPWIIAMGHRPMYCSNNNDAMHCEMVNNIIRTGFPAHQSKDQPYQLGLEKLFYDQGVDIIIAAHEHSYERMWPVYNRSVCNSSHTNNPYYNPNAPIHIITGSAGNSEGEDPFIPGGQPWSAFRTDEYGFTRMKIYNSTHLDIEQISVEQGHEGMIIDRVQVVKSIHGAGVYNCH